MDLLLAIGSVLQDTAVLKTVVASLAVVTFVLILKADGIIK